MNFPSFCNVRLQKNVTILKKHKKNCKNGDLCSKMTNVLMKIHNTKSKKPISFFLKKLQKDCFVSYLKKKIDLLLLKIGKKLTKQYNF